MALALATLLIWVVLIFGRGFFWLARERDEPPAEALAAWPPVAAIIPARDEADMIAETLERLLQQDYPGPFRIILVDDGSSDGTAAIARAAGERSPRGGALAVLPGRPLQAGFTGKLFALKQGMDYLAASGDAPKYLLLTDADISHADDSLRRLVARAEAEGLVLSSLMAKLRCESLAERALIPAFVYFFAMLYPFAWVNDPKRATAAAAGGCVLVDRAALEAAGGIAAIRTALIDDCALGRLMKRRGRIRLALTESVLSRRPYPSFADIGKMVARSAYAQLHYSPVLLAATVLAMAATYLAAPWLALSGHGWAAVIGALTWLIMALSFQPMLRFYRLSPLWGAAMPAIACAYLAFTLDSAYSYYRGRGGLWKGRAQAQRSLS